MSYLRVKRTVFCILIICLSLPETILAESLEESVRSIVKSDESRLDNLFQTIHKNPELGFQETQTATLVVRELKKFGYDVTSGIGKTGVVAVMKNGKGPVVMFRADMDALPVKEESSLSFKSTKEMKDLTGELRPVMHACGHDAHTTWLTGVARVMTEMKSSWAGTLVLVAQPAEELMTGATAMVEDGLYNVVPTPDILISAHTFATLPAGHVAIREGIRMAGADQIDVTIHGVGGHGSTPHMAKDPVVMASLAVLQYQILISRFVDQSKPSVLTVGSIQSGMANNIIPDSAKLMVNIRWFDQATRKTLTDGIRQMTDQIAASFGMPANRMPKYEFKAFANEVVNDSEVSKSAFSSIQKMLGSTYVNVGGPPVMGSEDFPNLAAKAPGTKVLFIEVGSGKNDVLEQMAKGKMPYVNHNPKFQVEPGTIVTGTKAVAATLLSLMKVGGKQ